MAVALAAVFSRDRPSETSACGACGKRNPVVPVEACAQPHLIVVKLDDVVSMTLVARRRTLAN